jgi:hypothetical protein
MTMHRQAITTKFHGPTDSRGARVSARAAAGRKTVSWDYASNSQQNHATAAQALAEKLNWSGVWVSGGLPDESGDVFVLVADSMAGVGALKPAFVLGARS